MVVRQPEHGRQTGKFATAWGNEVVAPLQDRIQSHHLASTHHDDGWATWELHPSLDPDTHHPVQFHSLSPLEHVPLYRTGINRAVTLDPFAGLLVSMHGAGLYNDRYGTFRLVERSYNVEEQQLVDEFLHDMEALQSSLAASLGIPTHRHVIDDPVIRASYLRLQVWDRLSLQYVYRLADDGLISPLPLSDREGDSGELMCRNAGYFHLELDPYPFENSLEIFPVRAFFVRDRPYRDPEDFLEAIRDATEETIECRATPSKSSRSPR